MKKLSILLSVIFLSLVVLPLLSSCNGTNYNKFEFFSFNDFKGEFISSSDSVVINDDKTRITFKESAFSNTFDCECDNGIIKIKNEERYYYSQYFIAPIEAKYGQVQIDSDSNISGYGNLQGDEVKFNNGEIISNGVKKGSYEQVNNYVIINYNGAKREYLALRYGESEGSGVANLFDKFYSNIKILAKKVDNTGFTVDTKVLTNVANGKIEITPNVTSYAIKNITVKVVDNGGFVIYLGENGVYEIRPSAKPSSDEVKLLISVDDIEKTVQFTPILFMFDQSLLVVRYVGDTIDFSNEMFFTCKNFPFNKVLFSVSVIDGEKVATIDKKMLTFTDVGQATLQLKASFTLNGQNYQVVDEVTIKSLEKIVEKEDK